MPSPSAPGRGGGPCGLRLDHLGAADLPRRAVPRDDHRRVVAHVGGGAPGGGALPSFGGTYFPPRSQPHEFSYVGKSQAKAV